MIRKIAHHTRGEARPFIPVQEKALAGSATCVAPRFKRNSDTSTQATLKLSCSHGLPKPEGRSRIGLFLVSFVMSSESLALSEVEWVETSLTFSAQGEEAKTRTRDSSTSVGMTRDRPTGEQLVALKLIRVRKSLENRVMPRRSEIFDYATKCRIQQSAGMPHIEVERHQFAIEMQLRLVVQRIAVVVIQTLFQRPGDDVAQCVKIKMEVERDAVVQSNAFVINFVLADEAKAECDDFAALSPDEEPHAFR